MESILSMYSRPIKCKECFDAGWVWKGAPLPKDNAQKLTLQYELKKLYPQLGRAIMRNPGQILKVRVARIIKASHIEVEGKKWTVPTKNWAEAAAEVDPEELQEAIIRSTKKLITNTIGRCRKELHGILVDDAVQEYAVCSPVPLLSKEACTCEKGAAR